MQGMADRLLVVANYIAEEGEYARPYSRSQAGEQDEPTDRHARQARRKRNVLPQSRDQAANEGRDLPVATERALRAVVGMLGQSDVLPVAQDQRPAQAKRYPGYRFAWAGL